jgi:hypothetical protein
VRRSGGDKSEVKDSEALIRKLKTVKDSRWDK